MDKSDMLNKYEDVKGLQELNRRIRQCKNMQEMQMMQIPFVNGDSGAYMIGLYNGMEMMLAIIEDRRPEFAGIPMEAVDDPETDEMASDEVEVQRTISGFVKGNIGSYMGVCEEGKEGVCGCSSMI